MEKQLKIVIASDLSGYDLKEELYARFKKKGYDITNFGCDSAQEGEYPYHAEKVAKAVVAGEFDRGFLICGTGQGITMAANKVQGARAALCYERATCLLAREHNDARILSMGSWFTTPDEADRMMEAFLFGKFAGAERHVQRIEAMKRIEMERIENK